MNISSRVEEVLQSACKDLGARSVTLKVNATTTTVAGEHFAQGLRGDGRGTTVRIDERRSLVIHSEGILTAEQHHSARAWAGLVNQLGVFRTRNDASPPQAQLPIAAVGRWVHVYVDPTSRRPVDIPQPIRSLLETALIES